MEELLNKNISLREAVQLMQQIEKWDNYDSKIFAKLVNTLIPILLKQEYTEEKIEKEELESLAESLEKQQNPDPKIFWKFIRHLIPIISPSKNNQTFWKKLQAELTQETIKKMDMVRLKNDLTQAVSFWYLVDNYEKPYERCEKVTKNSYEENRETTNTLHAIILSQAMVFEDMQKDKDIITYIGNDLFQFKKNNIAIHFKLPGIKNSSRKLLLKNPSSEELVTLEHHWKFESIHWFDDNEWRLLDILHVLDFIHYILDKNQRADPHNIDSETPENRDEAYIYDDNTFTRSSIIFNAVDSWFKKHLVTNDSKFKEIKSDLLDNPEIVKYLNIMFKKLYDVEPT